MGLEEIVRGLRLENEGLRKRVSELETGNRTSSKGKDDHVSHKFKELRVLMENELRKLPNLYDNDTGIPDQEEKEILGCISKIGDHGSKSAEHLRSNNNLDNSYITATGRSGLLQHIITLYLVELVFQPYAFGLSKEISDGMKFVEKDILLHGSHAS